MNKELFEMDELSSALKAMVLLSKTNDTSTASSKAPSTSSKTTKEPKPTENKKESELSSTSAKKVEVESYDRFTLKPESSIDYGYFSSTSSQNASSTSSSSSYYITTAINYTNGPAHMGHAYEAITTDAIARYHRLINQKTYFVTGSDEHGQKIANTAADQSKQPIDICDYYVKGFQNLLQRTLVSYNDYIRTTSTRHKEVAQALWNKCSHDVYLSNYTGWYLEREETFVSDTDAMTWEYKDPVSGKPLKKVEEESYFFKMSKYHNQLLQHINDNPQFIQPSQHRNMILKRLEAEPLRDLSISRTSFSWGIPVPQDFQKSDKNHVMYVWVDALSNYLTGVNMLSPSSQNLNEFWPANVHIIGKDILWFHTVIWPCLLFSAGIELPKQVFAHGFVNDAQGRKMSKSMGNVIDPHDILSKVQVDTFRWYLCKEASFGSELSFSFQSLEYMHNADLADVLGNLIHRMTNLCGKYCNSIVPDIEEEEGHTLPIQFETVRKEYMEKMDKMELDQGCSIAIQGFRDVNVYLTNEAPWHLKGDEFAKKRQLIVRNTLEAVYALNHLLVPFLVNGVKHIFQKLGMQPKENLLELNSDLRNLIVGTKVNVGDILYAKIEEPKEEKKEETKKKEKPKKQKKQESTAASTAEDHIHSFTKIEIKVGQITKIWNHETADKLYCEEINVGEETPRQIASGLRLFYTLEQLQDQKVLVVCNLKPSKLVGFESCGMILAAKHDGKVEIVQPPPDAEVGQRLVLQEDFNTKDSKAIPAAFSSAQVKKKKVWEDVQQNLKLVDGIATWKDMILVTLNDGSQCTVSTLKEGVIS